MLGVVISPGHFGWGLFCYSNFNFYYIDDEKKIDCQKQSLESLTIPKDIYVL